MDARRDQQKATTGAEQAEDDEAAIEVKGSYGSKVRGVWVWEGLGGGSGRGSGDTLVGVGILASSFLLRQPGECLVHIYGALQRIDQV